MDLAFEAATAMLFSSELNLHSTLAILRDACLSTETAYPYALGCQIERSRYAISARCDYSSVTLVCLHVFPPRPGVCASSACWHDLVLGSQTVATTLRVGGWKQ